ncbi:MAG TPA: DUF1501 domain-containing protein [Planctomycetaceae bacterium]|nr:DUF1501 domain-containing protein [Planctomycetaceae bacterium]
MQIVDGRQRRFCDGLNRRTFLQVGGLALGGACLPELLKAEEASGVSGGHKGIIMIYMPGGPPHQDLYDLKPEAPVEVRGEFDPIATSVPGIEICELLPQLAARMDRLAVIRSLVGSDGAHASTLCSTGYSFGREPPGGAPLYGSAVSALLGPTDPAVPACADLSERMQHPPYNITGAGFLGSVHAPFRPDGPVRENLALSGEMFARFDDRKSLLSSFDRFRRTVDAQRGAREISAPGDTTEAALDILTSSRLARALDLDREDPRVRQKYGTDDPQPLPYSHLGYRAIMSRFLIARRLIEAGVRCVTVSFADFDWHGSNFKFARKVFPLFDQGISALVDDIHDRGLARDVSVVAWGEFGRTPRINKDAGRDHWPQVSCALMAGGGMRTGQVLGSTNRLGETAVQRPVHYQEVLATLYRNLGLDVEQATVRDLNGRPRYLVDGRQPIRELA